MPGTPAGGRKAAATNRARYDKKCLEKYGMTYHEWIGSLGGKTSRGGGFAANRELARIAGMKGGALSRRGKKREAVL